MDLDPRGIPRCIGRGTSLFFCLVVLMSCTPAPAPGPTLATQCKTKAPAPPEVGLSGLHLDEQRGCLGARWRVPHDVHLNLLGGRFREVAMMRLPRTSPQGFDGRPSLSGEAEFRVEFEAHGGFDRERAIAMLVRGARPDPSGWAGYAMARGRPFESGHVPVVLWRKPGTSFAVCMLFTRASIETITGQCTVHSRVDGQLMTSYPMQADVALRMGLEDRQLVDRIRTLLVPAPPATLP